MTNLYDESFEKRIRIKYFALGLILGLTVIGVMGFMDLITTVIVHTAYPPSYDIDDYHGGVYSVFLIFAPLAYYLWYSRAKPKKHPHLNETVGLKDDWDRVDLK